jgi:hypothetical protein
MVQYQSGNLQPDDRLPRKVGYNLLKVDYFADLLFYSIKRENLLIHVAE